MKTLIYRILSGFIVVGLEYIGFHNYFPDVNWVLYYLFVIFGTYVLDVIFWLWKKLTS